MQTHDPKADPAIQAPDPQPEATAPESRGEPQRSDEPCASGQRKRYLASLPETPEAA